MCNYVVERERERERDRESERERDKDRNDHYIDQRLFKIVVLPIDRPTNERLYRDHVTLVCSLAVTV